MPEKMITVAQHMKLLEEAISDIFDPNNKTNIVFEQKRKELTNQEIARQVEERVAAREQNIQNELDRLQENHDKLLGVLESSKAAHHALLGKITEIETREENSTKLYETMVKLTASLQDTSEAFGRMLNLLETKTGTRKTGGV